MTLSIEYVLKKLKFISKISLMRLKSLLILKNNWIKKAFTLELEKGKIKFYIYQLLKRIDIPYINGKKSYKNYKFKKFL